MSGEDQICDVCGNPVAHPVHRGWGPCGTELQGEYDASGRTVSILDREPVAAAMLEAVRARMPRRAK